jgi:hypothetical protein
MGVREVFAAFCSVLFTFTLLPHASALPGERGIDSVRRVKPAQLEAIPLKFVGRLEAIGCEIPQFSNDEKLNNFKLGRFLSKVKIDLAVICSVNGMSHVLVLTADGLDVVVERLGRDGWYQTGDGAEYMHSLDTMSTKYLRGFRRRFDNAYAAPLYPDAICVSVKESAGSCTYRVKNRWHTMTTSD